MRVEEAISILQKIRENRGNVKLMQISNHNTLEEINRFDCFDGDTIYDMVIVS